MAVSSWQVGALPVGWHRLGWEPYVGFYAGLAAMIAAWLMLGRHLLAPRAEWWQRPMTSSALRCYVVVTALPFVFAAPFGRDLWSYAAQGNLVRHGLDPYTHGPNALPGVFTDQVAQHWAGTSSPYGPLWLQLCHGADALGGGHLVLTALLLRVPAFAGLLLWIWALPTLAHRYGSAPRALWLGAASPLTIVLGLGGGHNDLMMIGLLITGLACASRRGITMLAVAAALLALAVMIKSPAGVALAFVVPVWLHASRTRIAPRDVGLACAVTAAAAASVIGVVTLMTGLGVGWVGQVNASAPSVSWLSLPTAAVLFARLVTGSLTHLTAVDSTMRTVRAIGEVLAVAISVALWTLALWRRPIGYAAGALAAVALLAPAVQPWYFCWALALAGLVIRRRQLLVVLVAVSIAFPVMITPSGMGLPNVAGATAIRIAALATGWLLLRRREPSSAIASPA